MFISDLTSLPNGSLNAVNAPASPAISIVSIFIVLEFMGRFPSPGLTYSAYPFSTIQVLTGFVYAALRKFL